METKEMTCIVCPMGCRLTAVCEGGAVKITGNTCKRGAAYGMQEVTNPMRTVTSLVRVTGGKSPLCPVKTAGQIPKSAIQAALREIRAAAARSPIRLGDVLIENVAGTGVDVVATANR